MTIADTITIDIHHAMAIHPVTDIQRAADIHLIIATIHGQVTATDTILDTIEKCLSTTKSTRHDQGYRGAFLRLFFVLEFIANG